MSEFVWTEPLSLEEVIKQSRERTRARRSASPENFPGKIYFLALVGLTALLAFSFQVSSLASADKPAPLAQLTPKLTVPGDSAVSPNKAFKSSELSIPSHHPSLKNYLPKSAKAKVPKVPFGPLIYQMALDHDLDPLLFAALVRQESNFDPKARSYVGAAGLTQLMPATAAGLGVENVDNPQENLHGGAIYLRDQIKRFNSIPLGLAAYNGGPEAVSKYKGIPPYPETQKYVQNILSFYREFKNQG